MSDVLNRTTKQFLLSVNDPDFPTGSWIHNPTVALTPMRDWISSAPRRQPKYVNIVADVVTEMTDPEKDAVDSAEAAASLAADKDAAKAAYDELISTLKAVALITMDELNLHSSRINAILDAIDNANNLGDVKTAVAAINNIPTRTPSDIKTAYDNKVDSF